MQELPVEGRGKAGSDQREGLSPVQIPRRETLPTHAPRNLSTPAPRPPQLLLPASLRQPRKPGAAARAPGKSSQGEAGQLGMLSS